MVYLAIENHSIQVGIEVTMPMNCLQRQIRSEGHGGSYRGIRQGYVSIATLAQQQGISESYLEQLIASLKKAGLVESVRGAQGGYALSRKPEDIDVGEVLRALEGSTSVMDCVDVNGASCDNACSCSARPLCSSCKRE